jgi:hypothetical protein
MVEATAEAAVDIHRVVAAVAAGIRPAAAEAAVIPRAAIAKGSEMKAVQTSQDRQL